MYCVRLQHSKGVHPSSGVETLWWYYKVSVCTKADIQAFLKLISIGIFGAKRAFLHLQDNDF
jgi:hypothetical protein